jgi:hypothetical protein
VIDTARDDGVNPVIPWTGVAVRTFPFNDEFPNAPLDAKPQQVTAPDSITAHELVWPTETTVALFEDSDPSIDIEATGVDRPDVVPSPSCPLPFRPQQCTAPTSVTAHPENVPRETFTTLFCGVEPSNSPTILGRLTKLTDPSPALPSRLSPQQNSAPLNLMAQEVSLPVVT